MRNFRICFLYKLLISIKHSNQVTKKKHTQHFSLKTSNEERTLGSRSRLEDNIKMCLKLSIAIQWSRRGSICGLLLRNFGFLKSREFL
jgi:hypothetical protein